MTWRKSSYSSDTANCVEVLWRKASACANNGCVEVGWTTASACQGGNCVEVAWTSACQGGSCVEVAWADEGRVLVRDSKDPDGPTISYSQAWWRVRCDALKREREAGVTHWLPSGVHDTGDGFTWTHDRVTLRFTAEEWAAFEQGVLAGEFDVERLAETTDVG